MGGQHEAWSPHQQVQVCFLTQDGPFSAHVTTGRHVDPGRHANVTFSVHVGHLPLTPCDAGGHLFLGLVFLDPA